MKRTIITSHFNIDLVIDACYESGVIALPIFYSSAPDLIQCNVDYKSFHNIEKYSNELYKCIKNHEAEYIFGTSATEVNSLIDSSIIEKLSISEHFIGVKNSAVKLANLKSSTHELLRKIGINVTNGKLFQKKSEIEEFRKKTKEPLICKKDNGAGGADQIYATDIDNLPNESFSWYIEEFIKGLELSVNVFFGNGFTFISPAMFKGETKINNEHAMDKVRYIPSTENKNISYKINEIVRKIEKEGIFNGWIELEFIYSNSILYVMEINARYNGTFRASCYSCNENLYSIALKDFFSKNYKPSRKRTTQSVIEFPLKQDLKHGHHPFGFVHRMQGNSKRMGRVTLSGESTDKAINNLLNTELSSELDYITNQIQDLESVIGQYTNSTQ